MQLISYASPFGEQLGFLINGLVYHTPSVHAALPATMSAFLNNWQTNIQLAGTALQQHHPAPHEGQPIDSLTLLAPVPHPPSFRDAYAFRQHVATARRNRNVPMLPEFDQFPVFYFSNHHTVCGPGKVYCMPDHFHQLDFELEAAIVIGKGGKNITAQQADDHIAGLTILNDLSARLLQMEEMKLNLGPAKGKDFASVIGPALVTLNELQPYEVAPADGHTGKSWNLQMTCAINGVQVSAGNLADMHWTFAEIIERASYGVELYPGDIIGSGTVGTGCFLELNGTGRLNSSTYLDRWLLAGDNVVLQIEHLGKLVTQIVEAENSYSILKKKK